MNKQVRDLASTIKKIEKIRVLEEENIEEDTILIKFSTEVEEFFMMIKSISEDYIVINISNPISMDDMIFNAPKMEVVNKFNTFAVGTKVIISDESKNHFLFIREEMVRIKDVFNKDLIKARIDLALDLITSATGIFAKVNDEINSNGKE